MTDLKTIKELVQTLLEQDERCRNNDGFLYLRVLFTYATKSGINLDAMSIPDFLVNHHGTDFPIFESVRRARQKLQAANPDLAACEAVQEYRAENEKEYRAFARGEA